MATASFGASSGAFYTHLYTLRMDLHLFPIDCYSSMLCAAGSLDRVLEENLKNWDMLGKVPHAPDYF